MKKIILVLIITTSALCAGCSTCGGGTNCGGASYSCCGADSYTGNWY